MSDAPKRGRGRPSSADPRSKVLGVRFTAREIEAIESAASSEDIEGGQTAGEWLRRRALEALGIDS